jgi:hypothetical protein
VPDTTIAAGATWVSDPILMALSTVVEELLLKNGGSVLD